MEQNIATEATWADSILEFMTKMTFVIYWRLKNYGKLQN